MVASKRKSKHAVFIEEYLRDFNGTQAAIRAGYSPKSAYSISSELLKNPEIAGELKRNLDERLMTADEVLKRLADMARGDMGNFLDISSMSFQLDLKKAKDLGLTHLIRRVKQRTVTAVDRDGHEEETNTIEIELYDAQQALALIARYHGLLVDRSEITGAGGRDLVDTDRLELALRRVYGANKTDD